MKIWTVHRRKTAAKKMPPAEQRESGEEMRSTHQLRGEEASPSGMTRLKTERL